MARDLRLEANFPNLESRGYKITSPATPSYNCVAWAAGDNTMWWEPLPYGPYYWPLGVPLDGSVASYVRLFESLGYHFCSDGNLERGYEKVAIYQQYDTSFTHVARQTDSGLWTSKLGKEQDIEHGTLDALDGPKYGQAVKFMQRQLPKKATPPKSKRHKKEAL